MEIVQLAALSRHFPYENSATHMEAEAFRAGLLLVTLHGWNAIHIESDCASFVKALQSEVTNGSEISMM